MKSKTPPEILGGVLCVIEMHFLKRFSYDFLNICGLTTEIRNDIIRVEFCRDDFNLQESSLLLSGRGA